MKILKNELILSDPRTADDAQQPEAPSALAPSEPQAQSARSSGADGSVTRDPAKVEALIRAALRMPRGTPAPGCCATEHTYILSAGQVWALDAALIDLGFPYTPDGHSPNPELRDAKRSL